MPDLFNFALVFTAYFTWLYKEVTRPKFRFLAGAISDGLAAVLLAAATYSKPTHALLIAPIVLLLLWRRQLRTSVFVAVVFGLVAGGLFGLNAAVTGEFNYQGGDRKTFYGSFPFESTRDVWNEKTELFTTNDADTENVLAPSEFMSRFAHNVEYFVVGRHFGFVPYFFPGLVALIGWLGSRDRFQAWRILTVAGVAAAAGVFLVFFPYTWSGGGGPPGNRYFLSLYPALFFVTPEIRSPALPLLAWAGGAMFTAKILVNPFVSAKNTWEITERGFARRLPVELTMANDLPVMLAQPPRGHIPYGHDPEVLLYFLDTHAFPPEPIGKSGDGSRLYGMWVSGSGRADIVVRSERALRRFDVVAESPIATALVISAGAGTSTIVLSPAKPVAFSISASGVRGFNSYAYLMSVRSTEGFVPHLRDPASHDQRNLGALVRFQAVE
jgi:hypothetical protein